MEKITYDDKTHSYKLNGEPVVSVTHIASEICGIKSQFFTPGSAEHGTAVHTELSMYYDPNTEFRAENFTLQDAAGMALFMKPNANMQTEVIVYNEQLNYAGTCDLVELDGNKVIRIVDFKSGQVNKKYCTVQLSLYKLALESMGFDVSDTITYIISPVGVTPIETKSWGECWDMQRSELDPVDAEELEDIQNRMKELAPAVAEYQQLESKLRGMLLDQLELSGATQYTGSMFVAQYVKPAKRVSFDSTRFQKEQPDMYAQYLKETDVRGFVKLTANELKDKSNDVEK